MTRVGPQRHRKRNATLNITNEAFGICVCGCKSDPIYNLQVESS
jgi:hypothetical protein